MPPHNKVHVVPSTCNGEEVGLWLWKKSHVQGGVGLYQISVSHEVHTHDTCVVHPNGQYEDTQKRRR